MQMPRDVEIQGKQEVQRLVSCKKRTGRAPQERKKKYVHVKTETENGRYSYGASRLLGATRAWEVGWCLL